MPCRATVVLTMLQTGTLFRKAESGKGITALMNSCLDKLSLYGRFREMRTHLAKECTAV